MVLGKYVKKMNENEYPYIGYVKENTSGPIEMEIPEGKCCLPPVVKELVLKSIGGQIQKLKLDATKNFNSLESMTNELELLKSKDLDSTKRNEIREEIEAIFQYSTEIEESISKYQDVYGSILWETKECPPYKTPPKSKLRWFLTKRKQDIKKILNYSHDKKEQAEAEKEQAEAEKQLQFYEDLIKRLEDSDE